MRDSPFLHCTSGFKRGNFNLRDNVFLLNKMYAKLSPDFWLSVSQPPKLSQVSSPGRNSLAPATSSAAQRWEKREESWEPLLLYLVGLEVAMGQRVEGQAGMCCPGHFWKISSSRGHCMKQNSERFLSPVNDQKVGEHLLCFSLNNKAHTFFFLT